MFTEISWDAFKTLRRLTLESLSWTSEGLAAAVYFTYVLSFHHLSKWNWLIGFPCKSQSQMQLVLSNYSLPLSEPGIVEICRQTKAVYRRILMTMENTLRKHMFCDWRQLNRHQTNKHRILNTALEYSSSGWRCCCILSLDLRNYSCHLSWEQNPTLLTRAGDENRKANIFRLLHTSCSQHYYLYSYLLAFFRGDLLKKKNFRTLKWQ